MYIYIYVLTHQVPTNFILLYAYTVNVRRKSTAYIGKFWLFIYLLFNLIYSLKNPVHTTKTKKKPNKAKLQTLYKICKNSNFLLRILRDYILV